MQPVEHPTPPPEPAHAGRVEIPTERKAAEKEVKTEARGKAGQGKNGEGGNDKPPLWLKVIFEFPLLFLVSGEGDQLLVVATRSWPCHRADKAFSPETAALSVSRCFVNI
jgi:hypothetical protein